MNRNIEPVMQQIGTTEQGIDISRRRFFSLTGAIAGAGILFNACRRSPPTSYFLGSGDVGLLNYLYVVKQCIANFYVQVNATPYYNMNQDELELMADLRDHHLAHKALIRTLVAGNATTNIVLTYQSITFADRNSVLKNCIAFEDLATGALNGVAGLFTDTDYMVMAAKMSSVEARQAAYVRDIYTYDSFADSTVVGSNGFDQSLKPLSVLASLKTFVQTSFDTSKLPN